MKAEKRHGVPPRLKMRTSSTSHNYKFPAEIPIDHKKSDSMVLIEGYRYPIITKNQQLGCQQTDAVNKIKTTEFSPHCCPSTALLLSKYCPTEVYCPTVV